MFSTAAALNGRAAETKVCISANAVAMRLAIEFGREADGRWIAEAPEWNVLLCGDSRQDAVRRAQSAVREITLDRIAHGELQMLAR